MKNWLEFENKYKNKLRDFMNKEEEREFISDYCDCCEKEGFNKTFWTPYEEQKEHIGKKFMVLRRLTEEECFLEAMPMWKIEFEDGKTSGAYPEEIVPSEMKLHGCPEKYLINTKEEENKEDLNCLYARLIMKLQCELFSYKEKLYRMTVDEVMNEAYKLTMLREFVKVFETQAKERLNAKQINFFLRMDNALEYLYEVWLGYNSTEQEIYADFLFTNWNWEM